MKTQLYTIHDIKAESYMPPFAFRTDGEAIRAFDDSVQKDGTPVHDHPEDFYLYRVGAFDIEKGVLIPCDPLQLACAAQFKKEA